MKNWKKVFVKPHYMVRYYNEKIDVCLEIAHSRAGEPWKVSIYESPKMKKNFPTDRSKLIILNKYQYKHQAQKKASKWMYNNIYR